ncbi:hypothetical protein CRG98_006847 [Punica granatum]|uniref:Retrotransposon gag domain-containing protein n=1 Tax=Punica granatum TaxID=22663 RepID=A0A2I0KWC3_PUNGR|nr:hypothetical protein CRG98_006847 [Punica granatum]
MEENIRALQSGSFRLDAGDGDWSLFPSMRLPSKIKVPEFQRGKMLQYWDYEEFVIHTFQDSLAGAALDWYMSLKAADIPTWADLSRKFIDQYKYCAKTPSTLLELSTMEMAEDQGFEAYAVKWRAREAKHEFHHRLNEPQLCNLDKEGKLGRVCNTHLCRFSSHKSIANFWQLRKLDPWPLILNSIPRIKIRISVVNTTWVLRDTLRTIVTPSGANCRR